ncbi:MAG: (2Fe-2S)-binding protein [Halobacteriales archaeon]
MSESVTTVAFSVNGEARNVTVPITKTLLEVLREDLHLTGTTHGCELGECGACSVLVDGEPELSCLKLAVEADGCEIETVEGLSGPDELHPLQRAFADHGAAQCGYCTPGMLMEARHLLESEPDPSRDDIEDAIVGNLCRCTGYHKIIDAIDDAAGRVSS